MRQREYRYCRDRDTDDDAQAPQPALAASSLQPVDFQGMYPFGLRRRRSCHMIRLLSIQALTRCCDSRVTGRFGYTAIPKKHFNRNPNSFRSHTVHAVSVRHARRKSVSSRNENHERGNRFRPHAGSMGSAKGASRARSEMSRLESIRRREFVALQLAAVAGDGPAITAKGRSVLLRGSPRLLDLAA